MTNSVKIAAFGALNEDSYKAFEYWLNKYAADYDVDYTLKTAQPYPNKDAVTEPGRPLRGDALQNPALCEELYNAVANDAKALGTGFDIYCMPCLSMVGFHKGVEKKLDHAIFQMDKALQTFYEDIDKIGVIHMRPAAKRIDEIFGEKAIRPDDDLQNRLLVAESDAKEKGNPYLVELVMKDITQHFENMGLSHVLYARADAPLAQQNIDQNDFPNIQINSYFQILAQHILKT